MIAPNTKLIDAIGREFDYRTSNIFLNLIPDSSIINGNLTFEINSGNYIRFALDYFVYFEFSKNELNALMMMTITMWTIRQWCCDSKAQILIENVHDASHSKRKKEKRRKRKSWFRLRMLFCAELRIQNITRTKLNVSLQLVEMLVIQKMNFLIWGFAKVREIIVFYSEM